MSGQPPVRTDQPFTGATRQHRTDKTRDLTANTDMVKLGDLGLEIWQVWDVKAASFQDTINDAYNQYEDWFPMADNAGVVCNFRNYAGPALKFVDDFIALNLFTSKPDSTIKNAGPFKPSVGCFKPGTQVMTAKGSVNIEHVKEGMALLTRAGDTPQFGVCSDECVIEETATETGPMVLWGFNDEEPFFSANHVFHTTTGLRALDPESALGENPWLQDKVAQLAVGHELLHSTDGKTYSRVPIQSLSWARAKCATIHGIHFREGLRSYHANGYLVHLNYPEITIKSMANLIGTLSTSQQINVLSKLLELRPLLDRFGSTTILQRLGVELHKARKTRVTDPYSGPKIELRRGLQHLSQAYSVRFHDNDESYRIDLYERVLVIDGEICKISKIEGRTIQWRRYLAGRGWEHGSLRMTRNLMTGSGSVYYGSEEELELGPLHRPITAEISRQTSSRTSLSAKTPIKLSMAPTVFINSGVPETSSLITTDTPMVS